VSGGDRTDAGESTERKGESRRSSTADTAVATMLPSADVRSSTLVRRDGGVAGASPSRLRPADASLLDEGDEKDKEGECGVEDLMLRDSTGACDLMSRDSTGACISLDVEEPKVPVVSRDGRADTAAIKPLVAASPGILPNEGGCLSSGSPGPWREACKTIPPGASSPPEDSREA